MNSANRSSTRDDWQKWCTCCGKLLGWPQRTSTELFGTFCFVKLWVSGRFMYQIWQKHSGLVWSSLIDEGADQTRERFSSANLIQPSHHILEQLDENKTFCFALLSVHAAKASRKSLCWMRSLFSVECFWKTSKNDSVFISYNHCEIWIQVIFAKPEQVCYYYHFPESPNVLVHCQMFLHNNRTSSGG